MIVYDLKFKHHPKSSSTAERAKKLENAKLSRLVFVVTATFAVCVLPYHCVALWVEFGNGEEFEYIEDLSIIAFFVLYLNSGLNPILYNVLSSQFRRECLQLLPFVTIPVTSLGLEVPRISISRYTILFVPVMCDSNQPFPIPLPGKGGDITFFIKEKR